MLTPGVSVYNPDIHSSSTDGSEIGGNGARLIWGQVNVDGITMVNNRHNYVNLYPSLDAIEEFKIQTGNYSAEYGGNAGTNINIQLKSGTKQFHGDLFDFFRNEALDARNYFALAPIAKNDIATKISLAERWVGPSARTKPSSSSAMRAFVPSRTLPVRALC